MEVRYATHIEKLSARPKRRLGFPFVKQEAYNVESIWKLEETGGLTQPFHFKDGEAMIQKV